MALTWALQTPGNPTYACSLQRSNGSQFCGDFELIFHFGTTEEAGWRVDWTSAAMKLSCESVTNIVVMAVVSEAKVAVCVILWESLLPMKQYWAGVDWNGQQEPIMRISFMFHTEWHGHGGRKLAKEGLVTRCKCANALHQDFCFFRELVYQHTTAKK